MPIDLCASLSKTSEWAFGSRVLNNILGSSLFVAIVLAIIMILLVMFFYPARKGTSGLVMVKLFLYMFLSGLAIVFLHDGIAKFVYNEERSINDSESMMQNAGTNIAKNDPVYGSSYKPVTPGLPNAAPFPAQMIGSSETKKEADITTDTSDSSEDNEDANAFELGAMDSDETLGGDVFSAPVVRGTVTNPYR